MRLSPLDTISKNIVGRTGFEPVTSSVSVQGSYLVAASDLAMNGSSGRPGWVLARRRCCHFCCHALAGRRWVMSSATYVSRVSDDLSRMR